MSQFGQGLGYCLGLFLEHVNTIGARIELEELIDEGPNLAYQKWFRDAGDCLRGFMAGSAPKHLRDRCLAFHLFIIAWSNPGLIPVANQADFEWAIQEAKDLLREIDAAHGVPTEKGNYE